MVDVPGATAVVTAAAQLGVERVERARVEGADLDAAEQRPDVLGRVSGVRLARAPLPGAHLEVLVEQLVHRGVRAGLPLLVDLTQQACAGRLGHPGRLGSGGDDLAQVVPALRDRVDSGIDRDSQRSARQLLDDAARPLPAGA